MNAECRRRSENRGADRRDQRHDERIAERTENFAVAEQLAVPFKGKALEFSGVFLSVKAEKDEICHRHK